MQRGDRLVLLFGSDGSSGRAPVVRMECPGCPFRFCGLPLGEHVHGMIPNVRGGQDGRRRRIGCWNRCVACGRLWEAPRCRTAAAAREAKRRHRLERAGQLALPTERAMVRPGRD